MSRQPVLSGKKLLKFLLRNGFVIVRQKGSHVFVKHIETGKFSVIPVHANEDLSKGLLKSVLEDLEIDIDRLS
jgi:predicted RNA binding protein YcfA (HicA-like mRNA interferase family)